MFFKMESHVVVPLSNLCPIQSDIDQVLSSKTIKIFLTIVYSTLCVVSILNNFIVFYYDLAPC